MLQAEALPRLAPAQTPDGRVIRHVGVFVQPKPGPLAHGRQGLPEPTRLVLRP